MAATPAALQGRTHSTPTGLRYIEITRIYRADVYRQ